MTEEEKEHEERLESYRAYKAGQDKAGGGNEEGCAAGCIVAVFIVGALLWFFLDFAGEGHREGVRGTASGALHHAACMAKPCDEDGHCPAWSHKYSKCYMLDKEGEKWLRWYENNGFSKKRFESENTTY